MKEELESLGFKYDFLFELKVKDITIWIDAENNVRVETATGEESVILFPYQFKKVKQLIKLLSYENA